MTHKNKKPRHVGLKRTILGMIISALIFPTLILFKDGKPAHTMVGNMPKADLLSELNANL